MQIPAKGKKDASNAGIPHTAEAVNGVDTGKGFGSGQEFFNSGVQKILAWSCLLLKREIMEQNRHKTSKCIINRKK